MELELANICVCNLSPEVTEGELRAAFGKYGRVESVGIRLGDPNHMAAVVMPIPVNAAVAAIALNGRVWKGQAVVVSASEPE